MDAKVTTLRELALLFMRLGSTAFGGPAAHIAMMRDEVVTRRGWLSDEQFLDLVSATNLIPGPNSTELAIHIGWQRRRGAGLVVAGLAFIVPAMLISGALGWAYVEFGTLPEAAWLLYGVKPIMLAIVARAILSLAPTAAKTTPLRVLGVAAAVLTALGVHEIAVLCIAGVAAFVLGRAGFDRSRTNRDDIQACVVPLLPATFAITAASAATVPSLFWLFFKTGSVLFGSGYVLLAFLRADLVERLAWLTQAQLIDAIAVGQVTPGPVFTTATFIGYILAGPSGAAAATAGIFLPAFIFVALSGPLVPRLRESRSASAVLEGVNVASLALMAVVTWQLGRAALVDIPSVVLGVTAALLLIRFDLNSTWLVFGGAAAGFACQALGLSDFAH